MNKISICVPFYPWYREYDRTEEIFNVLIPSINKIDHNYIELIILDCGYKDIWRNNRIHNNLLMQERIEKEYKDKVIFKYTDKGITPDNHKYPNRFWMASAVNESVKLANNDFIFVNNIDIEIPENFIDLYFNNVEYGKVWFPKAHNKYPNGEIYDGWKSGRGLVGITKKDYWAIGGTDQINYIKHKHDSDLFLRCKKEYNIIEGPCEGFFHVDHPGTDSYISFYKK